MSEVKLNQWDIDTLVNLIDVELDTFDWSEGEPTYHDKLLILQDKLMNGDW